MTTKRDRSPEQQLDDALADAETYLHSSLNELISVSAQLRAARLQVRSQRLRIARELRKQAPRS